MHYSNCGMNHIEAEVFKFRVLHVHPHLDVTANALLQDFSICAVILGIYTIRVHTGCSGCCNLSHGGAHKPKNTWRPSPVAMLFFLHRFTLRCDEDVY